MTKILAKMILFLLLSADLAFAQGIHVTIKTDSQTVQFADKFKLYVEAEHLADVKLNWEKINFSENEIEILSISQPDTITKTNEKITERLTLKIIHYAIDSLVINSISVPYTKGSSTIIYTASGNELVLKVIPFIINLNIDPKPNTAILDIPLSKIEIILIVAVIVLIIISGIVFYRIWKKKQKAEFDKRNNLSSEQRALNALELLNLKQYWKQKEFQLYYTELNLIIRNYLNSKTDLETNSSTVIQVLNDFKIANRAIGKFELSSILFESDLIKFAKLIPASKRENTIISDTKEIFKDV